MNVVVFCSANDLEEKYTKPAKEFAGLLAKARYGLVWGGSDTGLMKEMATAAQEAGGKIVGVTMILQKT
jgi:predicted Rossmann-fold nucleotide-binding protein